MGFLSVGLLFLGYLLVYGATANHGKFATAPLQGLFADAYGDDTATSVMPGGTSQGGRRPTNTPN